LIDQRGKGPLAARDPRGSFSGDLAEVALPDLVQTLELGRRTGTLHVRAHGGREALVWIRDGRIVDCELGAVRGDAAFYRLLRWDQGEFSVDFEPVQREARIAGTNQQLILEGTRRADELARVLGQLSSREAVLQIDYRQLSDRLAEIPDDVNGVLKLVDGRRTVAEILEEGSGDELAAAVILARLCVEELVRPAAPGPARALAAPAEPPAPAPATPGPERVTWFAGPADEPPAPVKETPAPPDEPAPGMTEPPPVPVPEGRDAGDEHAPRIIRFPPRIRDASPTPTPSELGVRWEEEAPANGAARAPQARQVPSRRSRRAEVGLALALGALVLALSGAWVARGRRAPHPEDLYRSALVEARRDHQAGHLGAAIDGYRRALGAVETSAAQAELGLALRDAGQLDAAVEALRRALALDAGNGSAYIALGEICLRDHRLEDARSAYQHYLALEPEGEHAAEARAALAGMR
jgi:Domain of unknown function (DUF4388)/Tetratricopeptide repeat